MKVINELIPFMEFFDKCARIASGISREIDLYINPAQKENLKTKRDVNIRSLNFHSISFDFT